MSRTPRFATRVLSVGAALSLGIGLTACSAEQGSSVEPAASETTSTSAAQSASPSPTVPSPEEKAITKAETAVRKYFRVMEVSLRDPKNFNVEDFKKVAITTALSDLRNGVNSHAYQGVHQVGGIKVESIKDPEVSLTNRPNEVPPEIPNVIFTVCYDLSDVDVVTEDGTSIVTDARPDRVALQVGVANYEYPKGPWLVDFTDGPELTSC
ncbi:hypothetical protein APR04_001427 [Promicromonospora umidemergens]|uniref:Secreted protein n=1 Tax=Promicromonospora umidemergens TaxID=629679 RepID=A0ABP8Y631_9MICO|nr:hypothetical protein [Promicromonospora umidemergens]MCP2282529.1 hypothetical protein [Promicromonospora umidemergens]